MDVKTKALQSFTLAILLSEKLSFKTGQMKRSLMEFLLLSKFCKPLYEYWTIMNVKQATFHMMTNMRLQIHLLFYLEDKITQILEVSQRHGGPMDSLWRNGPTLGTSLVTDLVLELTSEYPFLF